MSDKKRIPPALARGSTVALIANALLLAGCATSTNLSTGERSVSIEAGATPAASTLAPNMQSLLHSTSPSYVTLIVNEKSARGGNSRDEALPKALTSGSGFVIDPSGYVLTAGHVGVRQGNLVDARGSDGKIYQGKVVALQRSPDIALIKLNGFVGMPVRPVANVCLRRGTPVFSLGKPHAKGDTARIGEVYSMTFGRPVTYNGFGYPDAMVLKMGTQKGESGGPVFNQSGQLSGMVVSTLSDGKGHSLNLAHALPASMLAKFVCRNSSCAPGWRRLASQNYKNCKG